MGGSVFSLLQIAKGLDRSRYEPFVLFRYDLPARRDFESIGVRTATRASIAGGPEIPPPTGGPPVIAPYKLSAPYRLFSAAKECALARFGASAHLAAWMRREGFSILHANNSLAANIAAIVAARRAGIAAVSHQRGFSSLAMPHRLLSRRVDRLLCVSEAVRAHYVRQGLPPERLRTVYNGIDTAALRPRPKERRDHVRIGWFGRLERWKGAGTFIDAARMLAAERRDVRFVMVGTGSEERRLRAAVETEPALANALSLLGYREDFLDLLAGCDILANTSIEPEPLSRSALEALAFGIPVVASNCGGNSEIVVDGANGFLFESGNAERLAAVLRRLAGDGALRERLGAEGRRRAETLFSAERCIAEIEAVYADVIGS